MSGTGSERDWRPTACILCYLNCGVEVTVEDGRIARVRGDKAHPRSHGYVCQKAQRLAFYADHSDRLRSPLRRDGSGALVPASWGQVTAELADRLGALRAEGHGRGFAVYGGGGQGNHSAGPFGVSLLRAMGSDRFFNALSQEKTGDFWVNGHLFGAQTVHTAEDVEHTDLLLVIGANPWMAHGFTNARNQLNAIRNDPDRRLVVIDPRRTEAAAMADLHLQLRPGTDAFLLAALLALLLARGGADHDFLAAHTTGFEAVATALRAVPVEAFVDHAGLTMAEVERAAEMILAASSLCVRVELGLQQSRHSTLNSYLEKLLFLTTGHFGRPGTNNLHSWLQPLWSNSGPTAEGARRSPVTGQEQIAGLYPPNLLADEIMARLPDGSAHPDRIRALWVDSANPANTAADSRRFEEAAAALDLLVVVDVALTETAALADYVLPAPSQYEKWEFTFFNFEFPANSFHLRRPVLDPLPGTLPEPEIYSRLLGAMGLMPAGDEIEALRTLAATDRAAFGARFSALLADRPTLGAVAPVVLYETLGRTLPGGAAVAAPLWAACHALAGREPAAVRAAGIDAPEAPGALGEALFERMLASPSGFVFSVHGYDAVWSWIKHPDGRVHLAIPELLDWLGRLDPAAEAPDAAYPFMLVAGQRRSHNANQIFRDPAWRKTDPDGALRMAPADLSAIGATDGGWVAVETKTGRLVVRAESDDSLREGVASLPHGYGASYPGADGERRVDGPRLNLITATDDRDPIAATPHHKNVAVALRPATPAEAAEAAGPRGVTPRAG